MDTTITVTEITRVGRLIEQVLDSPGSGQIDQNTRFDELGMQSINRMMLATLVEQEFCIDLESRMAALVQLTTVGDLVRFLREASGAL